MVFREKGEVVKIEITVKIYADLRSYVEGKKDLRLNVDDRISINNLIKKLGLPVDKVKITMVNGRRREKKFKLSENDRVALFPSIAGGDG